MNAREIALSQMAELAKQAGCSEQDITKAMDECRRTNNDDAMRRLIMPQFNALFGGRLFS